MDDIQKIIEILDLTPLSQEGGLFRSSYRSPPKADGRDMGSAIYFMLTGHGYSHLHRLCTDEEMCIRDSVCAVYHDKPGIDDIGCGGHAPEKLG